MVLNSFREFPDKKGRPAGYFIHFSPRQSYGEQNLLEYGFCGAQTLLAYDMLSAAWEKGQHGTERFLQYRESARKTLDYFVENCVEESGLPIGLYSVDKEEIVYWWTGILLPFQYSHDKMCIRDRVCILTYDVAFVCRERGDGFKAAMAENEGIEVLEVFDGVCTEDAAMKKTEDWLQQYPDVTAIFGNNSNCGVGIAAAVRSAGKTDDILVANVDGLSGDIRNMEDGALDITAVYPMKELAAEAADKAVEVLETGKCGEDPRLKFSLCTIDDLDTYKEYWGIE